MISEQGEDVVLAAACGQVLTQCGDQALTCDVDGPIGTERSAYENELERGNYIT